MIKISTKDIRVSDIPKAPWPFPVHIAGGKVHRIPPPPKKPPPPLEDAPF